MISWVFMLILILYDMFMIDIHTFLLILYCFLYIFDIITGFLFFNSIMTIKINLFTRLVFVILYWRYSRLIILTFLYYLYKVRMVFYLLGFCIVFLAMVFNIIFFETPIENSPLLYSRLKFETFYDSLFSTFTIFTQENVINMFNQNMKYHSAYLVVLLPMMFILYYIILAFLVGLLTYFYNKIIRREIRGMEHFDKFKKVFYYFRDKDGIVSYQKINSFIDIFYKDPHNIDFDRINLQSLNRLQRRTVVDLHEDKMTRMSITRFQKREKTFQIQEQSAKRKFQELSYNTKHYKKFNEFRSSVIYRVLLVINDTVLGVSPMLIINTTIWGLNDIWFIVTANLAIFSLVDPFLHFVFALHKISSRRRNHYIITVMASIGIIFLSILIWIKPIKLGEPISRTYLYLYLVYSGLCFCKISTVIDQAYHAFPFFVDMLELLSQLAPFYYQIFTIILVNMLLYSIVGRSLFGGILNSDTYKDYLEKTNIKPNIKYEYFNFNDMVGSFLTLFTLLVSSDWIEIYDIFYFSRPRFTTTCFFVVYYISVSFIVYALMIGIISKFVLLYFNSRLNKRFIEKKKKMYTNEKEIEEANLIDIN